MDLSIIIPNFNTKDLLDRCLRSIFVSLRDSKVSFEVIVVDNASEDGSRELLNKKYPQVIKVFTKQNLGYGSANNMGIEKAKGEYVLLLNSDIKVLGNAIDKLFAFVRSKPRSFVGGKLLNEDGTAQASSGPMFTLPVVFAMLFLKGDKLGVTRFSPENVQSVDWVSGACIIALKSAFLKVGLFDAKIFMYMEEIDLLYRAKRTGYSVFFYPDATFIHSGAASSDNKRKPVINIFQGLVYFYKKHHTDFAQSVLRILLALKARVAILVAHVLGKKDTVLLYEEALRILK